ncbi:MAG: hypothetical protein MUE51_05105 [Thermoleophilia bacterium]|jgi:hypothetical protein|nr:hypothetical protein [Thermoleophilia bacterium]
MPHVPVPEGAEPPFEVYVNGEPRREGEDFRVEGRWIELLTPARPRPRLGFWHKTLLLIGIGVYGDLRGDVVDVAFRRDGRRELASEVPIITGPARAPEVSAAAGPGPRRTA